MELRVFKWGGLSIFENEALLPGCDQKWEGTYPRFDTGTGEKSPRSCMKNSEVGKKETSLMTSTTVPSSLHEALKSTATTKPAAHY